ncbi:COG2746 Aminoglycoside N3'-acetyltransferase [Burkholderiales bacterium]
MESYLFKHDGELISSAALRRILRELQADQCDVLYIHTGMQFGLPNLEMGRSGLLEAIAEVLYGMAVPTLIMPSYTFSFCDGQLFDRAKSASPMGALNEYMRVRHQWMRSCDPLMSNILHGEERGLLTQIGKHSVGRDSTFDLLSSLNAKVKFLFLGPRIHDCFTYMHYLEAFKQVPYRYDFTFTGSIIDGTRRYEDKYTLYIRDEGVQAGGGAKIYENMLIERDLAGFERVGGGAITVVDLDSARSLYLELLEISPNFYIEEVFGQAVRPTSLAPRKMVAL